MTMDISNFYLNLPVPRFYKNKWHPRGNHQGISPMQISNWSRSCLHRNQQRDVWTPTGRINNQPAAQTKIKWLWVLSDQISSGYMETWYTTNPVHIGGWWLWSKVCSKEHAVHLQKVLEAHYKLTCNWTGKQILALPSIGTTSKDKSTSLCQVTSRKHTNNSAMKWNCSSIPRTHVHQ